jgi:hypothetical protein
MIFTRFLDVLMPTGGYVLGLVETYFDESEEGHILSVSGYLFKKESAGKLSAEWNAVLAPHGINIFHMVDCAHGLGEFAHLKERKDVRIQIQKDLFEILKLRMEAGYSTSFDLRFSHLLPHAMNLGIDIVSPYSLCCYFGLMFARRWAETKHYKGKIAYFFEAGHKNAGEADKIMREIFGSPEKLDIYYRYAGHAFLRKEDAVPLQCADILAWQWRKYLSDLSRGKTKPRADLWSLLERPHFTIHFGEKRIREFISVVEKVNEKIKEKRKAIDAIAADALRRRDPENS